jgi:3-phenylpropionate/cinnamic acid dioxygenase small subunit
MSVVTESLVREVEQFLFHEACLLDEARYDEWLGLLAADIWYFCPLIEFVNGIEATVDQRGAHYFDENLQSLRNRCQWLQSPHAHVENPPSLKRRLVSNIQVQEVEDGVAVQSNFLLWQIRPRDSDGALFAGRREDRLRRVDGELKLCERRINLAHPVLPRALSVFF